MVERLADTLRSLYVLRVPVVSMLAFPVFTLLALWFLDSLLGNLILGLNGFDCGVLAFTAYLTAISAGFAAWIIEIRGPERLEGSTGVGGLVALPRVGRFFRRLIPAAPLAVLLPAILTSEDGPWLSFLAALAGAVGAVLLALLSWILYYLLPRRIHFPDPVGSGAPGRVLRGAGLQTTASMLGRGEAAPGVLVPGDPYGLGRLRERLIGFREVLERRLFELDSPFFWLPPLLLAIIVLLLLTLLRRLILGLILRLGPGYFSDEEARQLREPYPEHVISLSFFLVIFGGYLGIGYLKMIRAGDPTTGFTTAAYLCVSLTLLTTTLSGVTFALDRWPGVATALSAVLLAVVLLAPTAGLTDHYFETGQPAADPLPTPATVLGSGPGRSIVVAAAGGGIQAAAWTSTVLSGLDQEVAGFRDSLRAISGVSGGSVGAMYYLASFPGPRLDPVRVEEIRQKALASSLDEISAGLTFLEVLRIPLSLWKGPRLMDRGAALEQTFAERSGLGEKTLADWALETGQGRRPAVIFNSVEVETGRPVLFSTTRIVSPEADQVANGRGNRAFRLGPAGIAIPTAVRLSASFPFVTPVARPVTSGPESPDDRLHLADGGYYDNFGVTSLAHFLNDGLEHTQSPPEKLLILQIRSFPPSLREHPRRNFLFQIVAPLVTLLSVREEAQRIRNQEYLRVLQGYWRENGRPVEIRLETVDFLVDDVPNCRREPPLSWRLRKDQKECILEVWEARRGKAIQAVEDFLLR